MPTLIQAPSRRLLLATAPAFIRRLGARGDQPNILLCLGDNFSWPHMAATGNNCIATPHFDRIAREGALFTHAFCCAPSCTPSRASILTGQDIWRLEEGGNLWGHLPARFQVFPDILEKAGYHIGYEGKGYAPGSVEAGGRTRNPCGPRFDSFADFFTSRPKDKPFFFWHGNQHRNALGKPVDRTGIQLDRLEIPPFLPDCDALRTDFYHYFQRLRELDATVGSMLAALEQAGQLENTLVVFTADNGMDFPRGYPNLYDFGTGEFLALRWGARIKPGRVAGDLVQLKDLAATFLDAAGLPVPAAMTARTLLPLAQGRRQPARDFVVTARERHAWSRPAGLGYPMRAIRTATHLYIRNYEPSRNPAGHPTFSHPTQGVYGDIDRCETKWHLHRNRDEPGIRPYFDLCFGPRPAEELYSLARDPAQVKNLAAEPGERRMLTTLRNRLTRHLETTGDPRHTGRPALWDSYPYHAPYRPTLGPGTPAP